MPDLRSQAKAQISYHCVHSCLSSKPQDEMSQNPVQFLLVDANIFSNCNGSITDHPENSARPLVNP